VGRDGRRTSGRLAYSSWLTMQQHGEHDPTLCSVNDFALVAVAPADVPAVDPTVPGLGGPTGLHAGGTDHGDPVYSYQPNTGGAALKRGASLGDSADGRSHRVLTTPAGEPGDSGSGYLDADGRAVGVLGTRYLDGSGTNGLTDLADALGYADRYGGLGMIVLERGRDPFRPERY
jgi:hypothetical protein